MTQRQCKHRAKALRAKGRAHFVPATLRAEFKCGLFYKQKFN